MNDEENPQPAAAGADDFIARLKAGAVRSAVNPSARPAPAPASPAAPAARPPIAARQVGVPTLTTATPNPDLLQDQELLDLVEQEVRELRTDFTWPPPIVAAPSAPKARTVACVVTHGMGQQVPFETAASIASAFVRGRTPKAAAQANRVPLVPGGDLVSRMELHYEATATEPETFIHIYEGYWAPLTEGKITYSSILSFLGSTLIAGLRTARKHAFDRWIFKALRALPVKAHTSTMLLGVGGVIALMAAFVALTFFALDHLFTVIKSFATLPPAEAFHTVLQKVQQHWGKALLFLLIPVGAWIAYWIRWFLVQFLGDVIIYVSSYKVSAYEEVRSAIQKRVLDLAKQVVAYSNPVQPLHPEERAPNATLVYDGLVFVGHSLGSVVTYDTVNALITWDSQGCQGRYNLLGRIQRLLTFGSPLDKTAFLFRTQISKSQDHFRETMAANMQPLVLDYAFRTFPWVNLYSRLDPVSGALAYYDVPDGPAADPARRVINKLDPACTRYGVAHSQYWDGDLLSQELLAAVGLVALEQTASSAAAAKG